MIFAAEFGLLFEPFFLGPPEVVSLLNLPELGFFGAVLRLR